MSPRPAAPSRASTIGVQDHVAVAVAEQARREGDMDPAQHELAALDDPMDVGADADPVFRRFGFLDHNCPFVLGMSVPTILTAVASAWPRALKIASAMWWLFEP